MIWRAAGLLIGTALLWGVTWAVGGSLMVYLSARMTNGLDQSGEVISSLPIFLVLFGQLGLLNGVLFALLRWIKGKRSADEQAALVTMIGFGILTGLLSMLGLMVFGWWSFGYAFSFGAVLGALGGMVSAMWERGMAQLEW